MEKYSKICNCLIKFAYLVEQSIRMYFRIQILFLLFLFYLPAEAIRENTTLDSLRQELGMTVVKDSNALQVLLDQGALLLDEHPDSAGVLFEQVLQMAREVGNEAMQVEAKHYLSFLFNNQNQLSKSLELMNDLIQNHAEHLSLAQKVQIYGIMSDTYLNLGLIQESEEYLKKVLWNSDSATISFRNDILLRQAELHTDLGNTAKALDLAMTILEKVRLKPNCKAFDMSYLGKVFSKLEEYELAYEALERGLKCAQKEKDRLSICYFNLNLGWLEYLRGNFDSAVSFNEKVIEQLDGKNTYGLREFATGNLLATYVAMEAWEEAGGLIPYINSFYKGVEDLEFRHQIKESLALYYSHQGKFESAYRAQMETQSLKDSLDSKLWAQKLKKIEQDYLFEKEKQHYESERARQEASLRWRNALLICSTLFTGLLLYFFMVNRNKTKLKIRVNELLSQSNRTIRRENKELENMVALRDRLSSIISHDLRSSVGNVKTLSNMVNNLPLDEMEGKEYLKMIENQAAAAYELLENMLYWSKSQINELQVNPERLDLADLASREFNYSQEQAALKQIKLCLEFEPGTYHVRADKNMMGLVIRNIIGNALKFTKPHGKVDLRLSKQEGNIVLEIEDDGVGMTETMRLNILKGNNSESIAGTNNEKGSGLGLHLSHDFIQLNGGSLELFSTEGKGSLFRVYIPEYVSDMKTLLSAEEA